LAIEVRLNFYAADFASNCFLNALCALREGANHVGKCRVCRTPPNGVFRFKTSLGPLKIVILSEPDAVRKGFLVMNRLNES
jgi:hypothetical protein